ncbi:aldo/keto reductase [Litchfieldia salsa]|uniref:Predicted oxidoreductase n=1 Tax=Litchfieldia salsa TaxID=930152 RepID=A0A1H0WHS7_9BACI|nr:aldo/keto reductase [Litchfieldia salsa]SDP90035.1 Predicted oxidoreductase [Litchfieldia salsa]
MNKRQIGKSDLFASEIGLGCMSIGVEEAHAVRIIDEAIDSGINYLDTADLYDQGLNEEFVGKAIKGKRQDLILATKVGNRFERGKEGWSWDPSKKHIMNAIKESLRRLQTDYIDLYQLHGGTMEDHIDETIDAFEALKQEGVIRYYGISSIRPNVIQEYVKRSSIISVMMQYSILDRRPEEQVLPLLEENQISVLARGPVAKGFLTERSFNPSKEALFSKGYLDYSSEELKSIVTRIRNSCDGRSLTEIGLRYILQSSTVSSVIAGASNVEQLHANVIAGSSSSLTDDEMKQIRQLTKSAGYAQHRL